MSYACERCARRSWLLARLGGPLDLRARDLTRFWGVLELSDRELIEAVGGKRKAELHTEYREWESTHDELAKRGGVGKRGESGAEVERICRHREGFPSALREDALAPHALAVRGGVERLSELLGGTVVAVVGTSRATDYGMETARHLARGLSASGLTLVSPFAEGIPIAALAGALEASGRAVAVPASGVEHCKPAGCTATYRRVVTDGCAISETLSAGRARAWCGVAQMRTVALLAELVIVVEAEDRPWELACAQVAQARGKLVGAVPGRLSSRSSKGTNSLIAQGARLVRGPQDALDLLYGVGQLAPCPSDQVEGRLTNRLVPRLQRVLDEVGAGRDTVGKLAGGGADPVDVAVALTELELEGMLVRGDGGRYMPCAGIPAE